MMKTLLQRSCVATQRTLFDVKSSAGLFKLIFNHVRGATIFRKEAAQSLTSPLPTNLMSHMLIQDFKIIIFGKMVVIAKPITSKHEFEFILFPMQRLAKRTLVTSGAILDKADTVGAKRKILSDQTR